MKNALFYQTVADISGFLEQEISRELYTVMDGGETLEICAETLQRLREYSTWHVLESQYSQVGGYLTPVGDDSWLEVALSYTNEVQQSFQQQLESVGVPVTLASQCAEILADDDPTKEDLGRTPEERHLVQSAYSWMTAKST